MPNTARLAVFLAALALTPVLPAQEHWVASWATAPLQHSEKTDANPVDQTLREIVHLSLGGSQVRLTFSNQFGAEPLTIGGANVGLSLGGSAVEPHSVQQVTFGGKPGTTLAPGATVQSDPVTLAVVPQSNVAVSLFLPAQKISQTTMHPGSFQTNYRAEGNQLKTPYLPSAKEMIPWLFLTSLDVMAPATDATIVAFGDSITDGAGSTVNANRRWPSLLADRLQADPKYAHLGVVDEGIGGNRVLHEGTGPAAITRFNTDALAQSGVKYIIILESINDIGRSSMSKIAAQDPTKATANTGPEHIITADQLIAAFTDLIGRAHARGVKVIGATLTPFVGAGYAHPDGEAIREAVNDFIRHSGKFDGVIDFEKATVDPQNTKGKVYLPAYDHGDHLHPSDAGYKAMADSIDLSLFR